MADFKNPLNNDNNRNNENIKSREPNDTKFSFRKKQIDAEDEYKRKLDRQLAEEVNRYRLTLYYSTNKLSIAQQKKLTKEFEDFKRKQLEKSLKWEAEHREEYSALERKKAREEDEKLRKEALSGRLEALRETLGDENQSFLDKVKTLNKMRKTVKEMGSEDDKAKKQAEQFNKIMSSISNAMKGVIDSYSKYQSTIDTRLQGTNKTFGQLQGSLLNNVGITPYLKTQVMLDNLQKLVETGIAFNLEQRAFLSSVSDKVASTFNAFDSNLLRIVRLQQADSTASRMGMEAYLTKFLNNMFSNTEYLNNSFDTVTGNLVEATSQMSTQMAVQFEYITQKWLGSLSSVGLSDAAISSISEAIGYLATGNVSGLESSSMQNLIVMAASRVGLSYADMLTRGINLSETNTLLGSMVEYLQQIGSSTNQVVKNQYASTFGVSVSDLRAAANLNVKDIKAIGDNMLSYTGALGELTNQLSTITQRLSMAEKINNVVANAQYSLYTNIAASPSLMSLWSVTDMIQEYTGGINIPSVLGTGPNTTVENLMKLGIIGVGSLGMIGDIISGIGNTIDFSNAFAKLGGNNLVTTSRGTGLSASDSGFWTSESSYIGQSSGSDFYKNTMEQSKRDVQNQITNNETSGSDVDMKKDIADVLLAMHNNVADILGIMRTGVPILNYGLGIGGGNNTNV